MGGGEGKSLGEAFSPPRSPLPSLQIKSDKQQPGVVVYSIKGPGVDEDPKDIFSIDNRSGKVYLNTVLDREKHDRFRVRKQGLDSDQFRIQMFGSSPPPSPIQREEAETPPTSIKPSSITLPAP